MKPNKVEATTEIENKVIDKYETQCREELSALYDDVYFNPLSDEDFRFFTEKVDNCRNYYKRKAIKELEKLNDEEL